MKRSWLLMVLLLPALMVFGQSKPKATEKGATIHFDKTYHDFGKLFHGGDGSVNFVFQNTGSEPLLLLQPRSSCGCTVASWPKEPVMPGDTAHVTVSYNTHLVGPFTKTVTILSNAQKPVVLRITGKVYPRPPAMVPVKNVNEGSVPEKK